MILTGAEIAKMRERGSIQIEPYSEAFLEPNSYGVHLGDELLEYLDPVIDAHRARTTRSIRIPPEGHVLLPDRIYLGHTLERIGGLDFASELYANLSTASAGVFIQTSAPLGHVGAVIRWTLEIVVAQPVILYPEMPIGKVCFWTNLGRVEAYAGRYANSLSVVASKLGPGT